MKRFYLFIFIVILGGMSCFGQKVEQYDIRDLMREATKVHPGMKVLSKVDSIFLQQKRLTNASWFPSLAFNAQASWQSEVPGVDFPEGSPFSLDIGAPKDQYEVAFDINQLIYDGGRLRAQVNLHQIQGDLQKSQVNTQLYYVAEQVSKWCFYRLSLSRQDSVLLARRRALEARYESAMVAVKSGVLKESSALRIQAEILILDQQRLELQSAINQSLVALNLLLPIELTAEDELFLPQMQMQAQYTFEQRPEMVSFAEQNNLYDSRSDLSKKRYWPTLSGFAHLGYGNPGLIFLQDTWTSYIKTGAALRWNLFDGLKSKRERAVYHLQKNIVAQNRASFELNESVRLASLQQEVKELEHQLKKDEELLILLDAIVKDAGVQMDAGTITLTDYLSDLERWSAIKSQAELHAIQLQQAKFNFHFYQGKW